jgi:hypothetical protein
LTRLSVAIQHHPGRDGTPIFEGLREALPSAEVVVDPDYRDFPNPWRCYRLALERTPPSATHRLIVQDDVLTCLHFEEAIARAVEAQPDRVISFCTAGNPYQHADQVWHAADQGLPWAELSNETHCSVIATLWPARLVNPLLDWSLAQNWPNAFRADDEIAGLFMRHIHEYPLATVPSLVEHPDTVPSMVGRRAAGGEDRGRVAACWIGECDPLTIDWSAGVLPAPQHYF